ncbi:MAG: type II toxin-antitoxin system HicA family toxin [Nitrososphaeria archaeon]
MSKLPKLSGKDVVKILVEKFGFQVVRQRGSHVVLRTFKDNEKIVTVVPLHDEVKVGTLLGILSLARITKEEFIEALK